MVRRVRISLKEMNPTQHSAAVALVSSALSPRGFEKVQQMIEGDEVNKINEGNNPSSARIDISVLGTLSETDPWMLQFGDHHLALNITIAGERGMLTPTLTGGATCAIHHQRENRAVGSSSLAPPPLA